MQSAMSLPFSFDSAGLVNHTSDESKIWQDRITIVLMTYIGERVMRPSFGSQVPSHVFENLETAKTLTTQAIGDAFERWLSALSLQGITYTVDPIDFYLVADIHYTYGPSKQIETVKLKTALLTRAGDIIVEAN